MTEDDVQRLVRLEASQLGILLWRNNVGVLTNAEGVPVRYGLANDSTNMNRRIKSADLIGIRRVTVTGDMIGRTLGVFVSREIKPPHWRYTATPREEAQMRWMQLVAGHGGDAGFATGEGSFGR